MTRRRESDPALLRRGLRNAPAGTEPPDPLHVLTRDLEHDDMAAVLHAARVIQLLGETARDAIPAMRACKVRCEKINPPGGSPVDVKPGRQDMAMFVLFAVDAFLADQDPPEAAAADWIDLFDGTTLTGWPTQPGWDVNVADGEIHMLSKGKNLWLLHEGTYTNFEIQAEVHMPADAYNSGLGFRCGKNVVVKPGKPPRFGGYQCEVDKRKSGMIYAIGSGWVWPKGKEETARFHEMADDSFKDNDWNHLRVRADGDHLQIWINDTLTADVRDARHAAGSIALQHHGKGDVHKFRNIRLLPLP